MSLEVGRFHVLKKGCARFGHVNNFNLILKEPKLVCGFLLRPEDEYIMDTEQKAPVGGHLEDQFPHK